MKTTAIMQETVVRFSDGPKRLPGPDGRGPSYWSLRRWAIHGKKNKSTGVACELDWCDFGGQPVTSMEAYMRFLRSLNEEG